MILTFRAFVIGKERIRNPIETKNHSPQNQITQQHKKNRLEIGLFHFGSEESVHSTCETNGQSSNWPIERKLNWATRSWEQMWPWPNWPPSPSRPSPGHPRCALSALTAAVVPGGGSEEPSSPDGSLEGDGLESPLWPLFVALSGHPPPLSSSPLPPQECCLCSFDLWNDPWTLSVSVMFGLSDTEQRKGSASQMQMWAFGRRKCGRCSLIRVCIIAGGEGTDTTTSHLSLCWLFVIQNKALCVVLPERIV